MAYLITNENIGAYDEMYHFEGKDVLSVVGSGDQYFTCKLHGAKRVDVFDYSINAWYLLVLKFMAIRNFSYNDFYHYIIREKIRNIETYEKVKKYLPKEIRQYLGRNYKFFASGIISPCGDYYKGPKFGDGSIIPYFDRDNYYKLQGILNQEELPTFYHKDIVDLPGEVKGPYDIMIASNIFAWLTTSRTRVNNPSGFKDLLDKIPAEVVQANYSWRKWEDDLTDYGYQETAIPSVNPDYEQNYVYTYTKRKDIWIPDEIAS